MYAESLTKSDGWYAECETWNVFHGAKVQLFSEICKREDEKSAPKDAFVNDQSSDKRT